MRSALATQGKTSIQYGHGLSSQSSQSYMSSHVPGTWSRNTVQHTHLTRLYVTDHAQASSQLPLPNKSCLALPVHDVWA